MGWLSNQVGRRRVWTSADEESNVFSWMACHAYDGAAWCSIVYVAVRCGRDHRAPTAMLPHGVPLSTSPFNVGVCNTPLRPCDCVVFRCLRRRSMWVYCIRPYGVA